MNPAPLAALPLAVCPGEPAGVGPELLLRLLSETPPPPPLLVFANPELLRRRIRELRLELRPRLAEAEPEEFHKLPPAAPGEFWVRPAPLARVPPPGKPDPANAAGVLEALRLACRACLAGSCSALVTGPVCKRSMHRAGIAFPGHTEFLASLCDTDTPVMLLAGGDLRVALATTHLPLAAVARTLNSAYLERVLRVLDGDLRRSFGFSAPRIGVLGLNPHAGDGGALGNDEQEWMQPLLERLRAEGLQLLGPIAADTAFLPEQRARSDALLAMYHDQGLPVLKALYFDETVNITLGLPIVRTSVDHGTAYDLAGTGRARHDSLRAAMHTATLLWRKRAVAAPATS